MAVGKFQVLALSLSHSVSIQLFSSSRSASLWVESRTSDNILLHGWPVEGLTNAERRSSTKRVASSRCLVLSRRQTRSSTKRLTIISCFSSRRFFLSVRSPSHPCILELKGCLGLFRQLAVRFDTGGGLKNYTISNHGTTATKKRSGFPIKVCISPKLGNSGNVLCPASAMF